MRLLGALSVLIFLSGCLAILLGIIGGWAYLLVLVASRSVILGWVVFCASAACWVWYQSILKAPWVVWALLWRWADDEIYRRMKWLA